MGGSTAHSGELASPATHYSNATNHDDSSGSEYRAECYRALRGGTGSEHPCWKSQYDGADKSYRPADADYHQSRGRRNTKRATKRDDLNTSDAGQYSDYSVAMRSGIGNHAFNEYHRESVDRTNEYDGKPHQRTDDRKSDDRKSDNRKFAYSEFRRVRYGIYSAELNKSSSRQYATSDYAPESNCSVPFWHGEHW